VMMRICCLIVSDCVGDCAITIAIVRVPDLGRFPKQIKETDRQLKVTQRRSRNLLSVSTHVKRTCLVATVLAVRRVMSINECKVTGTWLYLQLM
jgi:hypothetical protein